MSGSVTPAAESNKGFQIGAAAARRAHACVTLLMAGGLTLATLVVVATVSIEVVTAAVPH
jgi:hypothetical protein